MVISVAIYGIITIIANVIINQTLCNMYNVDAG